MISAVLVLIGGGYYLYESQMAAHATKHGRLVFVVVLVLASLVAWIVQSAIFRRRKRRKQNQSQSGGFGYATRTRTGRN